MQRIGILGAYGAVGRATTHLLAQFGTGMLRIGGRDSHCLRQLESELRQEVQVFQVEIQDDASLGEFCAGCNVVINCAGPSSTILDKVARAALAAGANYVDTAGDEPVHGLLSSLNIQNSRRTAILSAGIMPGLTGLLPRWLAKDRFDRATKLAQQFCMRDRFSMTSAIDFLVSLENGYGRSFTSWKNGPGAARQEPLVDVELPFFPRRVTAFPFLTQEAERVAADLALKELTCHTIFEPGKVMTLLARMRTCIANAGITSAARELCEAADFDLFGSGPSQTFVLHMEGEARGHIAHWGLVFRANDTFAVTAIVVALAAEALIDSTVPSGLHYAAGVLDPDQVVARLRQCPAVQSIEVITVDASTEFVLEEGAV